MSEERSGISKLANSYLTQRRILFVLDVQEGLGAQVVY